VLRGQLDELIPLAVEEWLGLYDDRIRSLRNDARKGSLEAVSGGDIEEQNLLSRAASGSLQVFLEEPACG